MALSYPITLDGVTYPHINVMSIKRNFQVLDGENAGRAQNAAMIRDVKGTFYNYSMTVDSDSASPDEYDRFYEVISSPSESHVIVAPYAQSTLTFEAYVAQGSDELERMFDNKNRWGGLSFNFIAMQPQRTP